MTSFNPNYLPKDLSPNTVPLGIRALACEFWTFSPYLNISPIIVNDKV